MTDELPLKSSFLFSYFAIKGFSNAPVMIGNLIKGMSQKQCGLEDAAGCGDVG